MLILYIVHHFKRNIVLVKVALFRSLCHILGKVSLISDLAMNNLFMLKILILKSQAGNLQEAVPLSFIQHRDYHVDGHFRIWFLALFVLLEFLNFY